MFATMIVAQADHLTALRIARDALHRANARLPGGQKIQVLVNNSDGQGNSYGSHLFYGPFTFQIAYRMAFELSAPAHKDDDLEEAVKTSNAMAAGQNSQ